MNEPKQASELPGYVTTNNPDQQTDAVPGETGLDRDTKTRVRHHPRSSRGRYAHTTLTSNTTKHYSPTRAGFITP
jgi:hypothetical protein